MSRTMISGRFSPRARTALVGAASAVALAAAALVVPTGDEPAYAAPAGPVLKLERARSAVVAERYGRTAYVDLGVHVVAGADQFEVRVTRPSYAAPLQAVLTDPDGDVVLPAGFAREDWGGLASFFRLTVTDAAGKQVVDRSLPFCPNSENQTRRRPDAPSSSPYPYGCGANPYALGQVWGLQRGFSTPAVSDLGLRLANGRYTARLAISDRYVRRLGLTSNTVTQVALRVVKGEDEEGFRTRHASGGHMTGHGSGARHTEATWDDPHRASPYATPSRTEMRELPQVAADAPGPDAQTVDLRSLPAWGIEVDKGRWLQFSATVWNAGPSPLVVDAYRRGTNSDLMDAYQYFYDADGEQIGYAPVGTMEWDARDGHHHWHFTDFASYRLLDKDKKLVVRSRKEAFCLANTDVIDYTVPNANWRPEGSDLHTSCGTRTSVAVRETLETGSGDTYLQFLPGQSFDTRGLPNGTYYVQVLANPAGKLHESRTSNNSALRRIVLGGKPGKRTVSVPKIGVITEPSGEDWS